MPQIQWRGSCEGTSFAWGTMWVDQLDIRHSEHWEAPLNMRCGIVAVVVVLSPRSVASDILGVTGAPVRLI
jgi:hypothetical protein